MIKLYPIGVFTIEPGETPKTIRDSLQSCWGLNFTSSIQEMKTGRVLPDDETIIDDREYYLNFTNFPT
jgi:hypothetical protein